VTTSQAPLGQAREDLLRRQIKPFILKVIAEDVHQLEEAEVSRRNGTQGNSGEELQILSCLGSKSITKYGAMRKRISGSDSSRSMSTHSFRRQRVRNSGQSAPRIPRIPSRESDAGEQFVGALVSHVRGGKNGKGM
jgi:hypothetical protein